MLYRHKLVTAVALVSALLVPWVVWGDGASTVAKVVAVTQSGTWTVQPGNVANTTAWKVDGSAVTQPVSGTVTANVGTTNGLLLDATLTGRFAAAFASADAVAAQTSTFVHGGLMGWNGTGWDRLQVDASKFLKVNCATGCAGGSTTPTDAFANPTTAGLSMVFPVGWNGATWDRLQVDGSKFLKVNCAAGCAGGSTTPTDAFANPTTAGLQMGFNMGWNGTTWDRLQVDASKYLKVAVQNASIPVTGTFWQATQPVSGTVTANIGTSGSLALDASVTGLQVAQGSTTSGQKGSLALGAVTTSAPTYTTAQSSPLSLSPAGNLRVDGSSVTQPVSGTFWQATQPVSIATAPVLVAGSAIIGKVGIDQTTPGTTNLVALAANQSVNVSQMNGVAVTMGNGVAGTGVQRVAIASDNTAFTVNAAQSGTWTVQPGNTANTTPWLVQTVPGTTNGGSTCNLQSAATTNATNCKASAGTLYGYEIINTTGTIYYLRLYNLATAPTCSVSTGFIRSIPVPASTTGAGMERDMGIGEAYGTGLGFCLTGGGGSTDNTSAATGVYISLLYK